MIVVVVIIIIMIIAIMISPPSGSVGHRGQSTLAKDPQDSVRGGNLIRLEIDRGNSIRLDFDSIDSLYFFGGGLDSFAGKYTFCK